MCCNGLESLRQFIVNKNSFSKPPRLFFTAPMEPVLVRRGDALGLRAISDEFADAVAPDLNNSVGDGRWVTILAWCLQRSHEVFLASGGQSLVSRAEQRARYDWLRPLELMWVARTIAVAKDFKNRQLFGVRRVQDWQTNRSKPHFGMSEERFRAYRQTGTYAGYRLAFRKWPGMTVGGMTVGGDGWTPGPATRQLAKWLDGKLGKARPPWGLDAAKLPPGRIPKPGSGKEAEWWLRQWKEFDQAGTKSLSVGNTLPSRRDDFSVLPEAKFLRPLIFGTDSNDTHRQRRLKIIGVIEKSTAKNHQELCRQLANAFPNDPIITLLPAFSRLADAGMAAMDLIAQAFHNRSQVKLSVVADSPDANQVCTELFTAAKRWRDRKRNEGSLSLRHIETADRFADAIMSKDPRECLKALLLHHEISGGGLRWFVLRDGQIEPRTPPSAGQPSLYRFRLWTLCRLATQCGVLKKMPSSLLAEVEPTEEEEEKGE